ncbi:MAG: PadR family transcriptional regulator [Lentisphaeraceae bacterium]|nr:PadR family transcriptional regulator [Lentisphaeraceae bacterium]
MEYFDNWTVQLRKGILEACILNSLRDKDTYGYELVKMLVNTPALGVTEGTVYPLLSRLKKQKLLATRLVESTGGPARKYYTLTDEGRATVELMNIHMAQVIKSFENIKK